MNNKHDTDWTRVTGKIIKRAGHLMVVCDIGNYYVSNFEPNRDSYESEDAVECDVGHPGEHRGVAQNLKKK